MANLVHASNQSSKLRIIPHFGDVSMILQFVRSKIWREFYEGSKKPYWRVFVWLLAAKIETFALPSRSILRYLHGRNTTGGIMGVWTFSMIAAFNVEHILGLALAFIPYLAPLLFFVFDWDILTKYLFISVKSNLLMGFMMVFALIQFVHVIGLRFEKGQNKDAGKRGDSWLILLLPNRFSINEIWVQAVIEPLLIFGTGALGWWLFGDMVFFSFMALSAISLCLQELADEMYRMYHGRI